MVSAKETEQQREALKTAYNSAAWSKKVNLMDPQQVLAIYLKFKREQKIR